MNGARLLTFRQAALVAGRSVRTLHSWRVAGMATSFDAKGRRVVREDEVLRHKRIHLRANPVHQQRMRAAERDTPRA